MQQQPGMPQPGMPQPGGQEYPQGVGFQVNNRCMTGRLQIPLKIK